MTRSVTSVFRALQPFNQVYIPLQRYNLPLFTRTVHHGYRLSMWHMPVDKIVYEICKPFERVPYTFVTPEEGDATKLFVQLYHSGQFETEEDELFTRQLYKELLGQEYDVLRIAERDFDFEDDAFICHRASAVDVMARIYFHDAVDGGLIFGEGVTTYKREVDR